MHLNNTLSIISIDPIQILNVRSQNHSKKFKTLQRKALKNSILYEVKHIQKHTKFNTFNTQIRSKIQYIQLKNSLKKYRKNISVLNKIKVFNSIK